MKPRILVVDDEAVCTYFLCSSLGEEGYDVRSAASGEEALEVAADFKPELLITDWMLKDGMDGVDVARELHLRDSELKIVFITGMTTEAISEKTGDLPFLAVLEKPIELGDILKLIESQTVS